ncbi:MAG: polysaccharide biosynthesis/export family protein [bacterium]
MLLLVQVSPAFADNGYRLGAGDQVRITVFQEPDLSVETRISTNGSIDYPLLGTIKLAGKSLGEATRTIDQQLRGDYLVNPRVSVSVVTHRPFFISGEVRSPGSYEYQPGMTVRQAIAIAGDFTDRAARGKIFLIREGDTSFTPTRVDLDSVIGPGDTLTIKESLF